MTDITAHEFLEILKDPNIDHVKRRVLEMIRNPKTQIIEVAVSDFSGDVVTTTIRMRTYE